MHLCEALNRVPRSRETYNTSPTVVPIESPVVRCQVPLCTEKCTISGEELALGMPQLCDTHFYEPIGAA